MASNLVAMAFNLEAMASNLVAMLQPRSDGLQPSRDSLQLRSDGLQPNSKKETMKNGVTVKYKKQLFAFNPRKMFFRFALQLLRLDYP